MCTLCLRSFEDASAFSEHYPKHFTKEARCIPCKRHFKNKFEFERHNAMKHSLRYICKSSECEEEVFLTNEELNDHIKENHSKECTDIKQLKDFCFDCPVCLLRNETWSSFDNHLRKHFGLFRCQICKIELPTKSSLDNHSCAGKHKKFRVQCTKCKKSFVFRHKYEDHVRKCNDTQFAFKVVILLVLLLIMNC